MCRRGRELKQEKERPKIKRKPKKKTKDRSPIKEDSLKYLSSFFLRFFSCICWVLFSTNMKSL